MWGLVTRDPTLALPVLGAPSHSRWTTGEVPTFLFLTKFQKPFLSFMHVILSCLAMSSPFVHLKTPIHSPSSNSYLICPTLFPDCPDIVPNFLHCLAIAQCLYLYDNPYFSFTTSHALGFPGGSVVKNSPDNAGSDPCVGKIPWRKAWQPTLVFLPGESPWTEDPGGLQSIGLLERVRHN